MCRAERQPSGTPDLPMSGSLKAANAFSAAANRLGAPPELSLDVAWSVANTDVLSDTSGKGFEHGEGQTVELAYRVSEEIAKRGREARVRGQCSGSWNRRRALARPTAFTATTRAGVRSRKQMLLFKLGRIRPVLVHRPQDRWERVGDSDGAHQEQSPSDDRPGSVAVGHYRLPYEARCQQPNQRCGQDYPRFGPRHVAITVQSVYRALRNTTDAQHRSHRHTSQRFQRNHQLLP